MGDGDGGAEDSLQVIVARRGLICCLGRDRVIGRARHRRIDRAGLDTKLGFCLGRPVELFIDRDVIAVEANVRAGAVRITFKDDVVFRRNAEE